MAGIVGVVPNRSGFASFVVRNWEEWMTRAVILHASGVSIPELRVMFGKSDDHLRNIMRTDQAKELLRTIQAKALKSAVVDAEVRIASIQEKALRRMDDFLDNDEIAEKNPFAFFDASRKAVETVSRLKAPAPQTNSTVNIQQTIVNAAPGLLERLRAAPTMQALEVPANVEYLGSPPLAGDPTQESIGRRDSPVPGESKNRLALAPRSDSSSAPRRGTREF